MSSFAKGNPFSLFFGDPFFWDPLFSFFLFFLSPAKVGSLEMQPGAKLQAYLGVIILQPHACTQRFRLRILCRTRSNAGRTSARSLSGRIQAIWKNPSKERDKPVLGEELFRAACSAPGQSYCQHRNRLLATYRPASHVNRWRACARKRCPTLASSALRYPTLVRCLNA